jgi:hypothetical protein
MPGTAWAGGAANYTWEYDGEEWVAHQVPSAVTDGYGYVYDIAPLAGYYYPISDSLFAQVDVSRSSPGPMAWPAAVTIAVQDYAGAAFPSLTVTITATGGLEFTNHQRRRRRADFGSVQHGGRVFYISAQARRPTVETTRPCQFVVDLRLTQAP